MKDLFEISLKAISNYVAKHIDNELNKNAYLNIINHITVYRIPRSAPLYNIKDIIEDLQAAKGYNRLAKYKFHFVANPKKYADLAYEHALDVANLLNKRFITGGESAYYVRKIDKCLR